MKTFCGEITNLAPNQIFVFGSNTQGRHGKGAALVARQKFGAIYGQAKGRQGQSYAIVTKDLTKPVNKQMRSVSLDDIGRDIVRFLQYAHEHSELEFFVVQLGSSLAGYTSEEIAGLFTGFYIPDNVYMNEE